ncbi:MAG: cobalt ECF transporter T component CbiQ [Clostridia bacterium]|nr:cobalt ECF transporter T component CbiQ [Clostridia bacterium]
MPLLLYPLVIFVMADIPVRPVLTRMAFALPLILGIGIFNPFLDRVPIALGPLHVARGWVTFFSLTLKGILTVCAALLLLSTCGLPRIAASLRALKVPRILVMQLLLTYRYLTVLMEEAARTLTAYGFRAPGQKGVGYKAWGSLAGQLLLRTFDRAERVYQAMRLRGFEGDFPVRPIGLLKGKDMAFGLFWLIYFILIRLVNIPLLLGGLS